MSWIPFLGRRTHTVRRDDNQPGQWAFLWELEYAFEFSDDQQEHLYKAWDCQRLGGMFHILREQSNTQLRNAMRPLAIVDYFPTQEDVERVCFEQHGGGNYVIQATLPTRTAVKTYRIEGSPKLQGKSNGRSNNLTTKQMVEQEMTGAVKTMMDEDPEIKATIMAAHLKKSLGIDIAGDKKDAFAQRFDKYLTENPDQEIELFQAEIRKRGGSDKQSEFERMTAMLGEIGNLQTVLKSAMGENDTSIKGMIGEGLKALPGVIQMMNTAANGGATVESQPEPVVQPAPAPAAPPQPAAQRPQSTFAPQGSRGPEVMIEGPRKGFPAPRIVESVGGSTRDITSIPVDRTPADPMRPHTNGSSFVVEDKGGVEVKSEGEVLELDTSDIDWGALLMETDWADLERATNGEPESFAKNLYVQAYDEDDKGAMVLVKLFQNNLPNAIVKGFVQGKEFMAKGWVQAVVATQGKTDDYQAMFRVVDKLAYTEDGVQWVNQVYMCCQMLRERLGDMNAADDASAVPQPESDEEIHDASWVEDGGDDDDYERLL